MENYIKTYTKEEKKLKYGEHIFISSRGYKYNDTKDKVCLYGYIYDEIRDVCFVYKCFELSGNLIPKTIKNRFISIDEGFKQAIKSLFNIGKLKIKKENIPDKLSVMDFDIAYDVIKDKLEDEPYISQYKVYSVIYNEFRENLSIFDLKKLFEVFILLPIDL